MPLINGQKMACEPCIRGHRSTKCTHANERLMVPVRKPGRPLSACPHPKSQSCGCGNVTAAIPRKQKCHCGTDASKSADAPEVKAEQDDQNDVATRSPSRASSGSISGPSANRVQKSTPRSSGARSNPTLDTSKLERMNPSQFNIINSPDATQQATPTISTPPMAQNLFPYGPMGMNTGAQHFAGQPMMFPMFPQPMVSPIAVQHTNGEILERQAPPMDGASIGTRANGGSCCGGTSTAVQAESSQPSTTPTTPGTDASGAQEPRSSCCSSKAVNGNGMTMPGASVNGPTTAVHSNGMMPPSFAAPMAMAPNGMYPFYPQPTIFTYPPQYGSFMQPLQPEQWRQFITNMSFAQPVPQPNHTHSTNGFDISNPIGFPAPGVTTMGGGTSHQCGCGDGCQCVGCAAHPYNEATQNYVRSAWNSMMEAPRPTTAGHDQHGAVNGHSDYNIPTNGEVALMKNAINGVAPTKTASEAELMKDAINGVPPTSGNPTVDGTVSPAAPQTPSEAASGMSEEQTLSANDFFFVSYPFGDSCAGDTASCPCGDDCQCIGCAIHGNQDTDGRTL